MRAQAPDGGDELPAVPPRRRGAGVVAARVSPVLLVAAEQKQIPWYSFSFRRFFFARGSFSDQVFGTGRKGSVGAGGIRVAAQQDGV